jgi:hypothetical protein
VDARYNIMTQKTIIRANSYPIGVKWPEYKTDHASLSNAKVKKNGVELPLPLTPSCHGTY